MLKIKDEVKAKVKALFPEDVEGIYISKNDYDRLYGDLTLENIELKQENEELYERVKGLEVASSKLDYESTIYANRIDKAIEYIEDRFYINEETGEYYLTHTFDKDNVYELLKMLDKGE